jgi:hypothetical protein
MHLYRACRITGEKEHSVLRTGEFYAFTDNGESESSDSDDTDTTVELSGKSSAAGPARLRVIRAFVSEEGLKPHVLLQTIVSQEELFSLRIQDCTQSTFQQLRAIKTCFTFSTRYGQPKNLLGHLSGWLFSLKDTALLWSEIM